MTSYVERPDRAEVRETHSGVVVLVGDRAYKVKKAVQLGFLDFRTEAARHQACRRELELNRRLAPDVYLDLATLTGSDGRVREHVIVMRRMPEQLRLSTLIVHAADLTGHLRALAELVAAFHAGAKRGPRIAAEGTAAGLRRRWRANLAEAEPFLGTVLDGARHRQIGELALRYIAGRQRLLAERADAGLVVDGHGDLIAEDIFCLPDHPRVLDCIEFDDRLRWLDVLDDVAFLAMDLEHLGRPDLAEHFLHCYLEASGVPSVPSLLHHYVAYRAFVRAKVTCIRATQGVPAAAAEANAFAALALRHLQAGEVSLTLVGGAPGTGKTTLATALSARRGSLLLRSDELRSTGREDPERYGRAARLATYRTLLARARDALTHGRSVVADATWAGTSTRHLAAQLAAASCSRLVALECHCPVELAAARAQHRLDAGADASEAGADLARRLAASRDPWPQAVRIDTSTTSQAALEATLALYPAVHPAAASG